MKLIFPGQVFGFAAQKNWVQRAAVVASKTGETNVPFNTKLEFEASVQLRCTNNPLALKSVLLKFLDYAAGHSDVEFVAAERLFEGAS